MKSALKNGHPMKNTREKGQGRWKRNDLEVPLQGGGEKKKMLPLGAATVFAILQKRRDRLSNGKRETGLKSSMRNLIKKGDKIGLRREERNAVMFVVKGAPYAQMDMRERDSAPNEEREKERNEGADRKALTTKDQCLEGKS